MGTLHYGQAQQFELEDRTLEHLRVVVLARFRRGESFPLTWTHRDASGARLVTLWVCPDIPLGFRFSGSARGPLSRGLVDALVRQSYSDEGLVLDRDRPSPPAGAET